MNIPPLRESAHFDASTSYEVTPLGTASPLWLRRAAFVVPVLGSTVLGTWLAAAVTQGLSDPLRVPLLVLAAVNLLYMSLSGWPAVLGCLLRLSRRTMQVSGAPNGGSRTALLMPVHNEDPRTVFAAMETMARAVAEAGLQRVDLFVLSDTRDEAIAAREVSEFAALRARAPDGPAIHYRRRSSNAGRKVGNLSDFCERWGHEYDYMLVLDADSLMGAKAIGTLIGLMDANPDTGIIQTVPYAVGRDTLFARIQQFAARLYTPLLVQGLTFWQQGDGNYWGHNAILRIAPFQQHCTLPVLPGREPFGGEILCHDVVEAGLMRAAGWQVWVLPQVMESYEGVPANLVDFTSRERRWCQGNLQHIFVLPRRGLRPVGRFHLAYGVMHYLAGPAAVLFLALATLDAALGGTVARALLLGSGAAHAALLGLSLGLLYAGKLLTLCTVLLNGAEARGFGGRGRLLLSAALEQLAALPISAVLIVCYTRYVAELLRGQTVRWDAQPRDDRGVSWAEGWVRLRGPALLGAAWLGVLSAVGMDLLAWAAPLAVGLLVAVPVAIWTSRAGLGVSARRLGLFLIPEEVTPSPVLRAYARAVAGPVPALRARVPAPLQLATNAAESG